MFTAASCTVNQTVMPSKDAIVCGAGWTVPQEVGKGFQMEVSQAGSKFIFHEVIVFIMALTAGMEKAATPVSMKEVTPPASSAGGGLIGRNKD